MTLEEFEQYAVENGLVVWSDEMSERAIKAMQEPKTDAFTIPKGATNGDVLCMLFPNMHYTLSAESRRIITTIGVASSFDFDWWSAPYKTESEG